jgi:hypothetical protein
MCEVGTIIRGGGNQRTVVQIPQSQAIGGWLDDPINVSDEHTLVHLTEVKQGQDRWGLQVDNIDIVHGQ